MGEHDPDAKHDERGGADAIDRDRIEYDPNPDKRGLWLSAIIAVLGGWMVVQAVAFDLAASQFWNAVFAGAALLAVGAYNSYRRSKAEFGSAGLAVFAALVGLWLVAAPFLIGPGEGIVAAQSDVGAWNDVVVGLLTLGLGLYSASKIRDRRRDADARQAATFDRRGH
ncbi:SPW repeat domain-containing protein [Natronorubrum sp. FCH18a]|uniref:SPW repeat domain-containing protein n=1 Tax=Natronorubrum sp. FCH18a TaxID=3447018 RepID=UPI003F513E84